MNSFIIVLAFSLNVAAQTPESTKKNDNEIQDRQEQELKEESLVPGRREKEKDAIPRGPYKSGIYQYEWKKKEETGEMP